LTEIYDNIKVNQSNPLCFGYYF